MQEQILLDSNGILISNGTWEVRKLILYITSRISPYFFTVQTTLVS